MRILPAVAAGLAWLAPQVGDASDIRPRSSVVWSEAACGTVVDSSTQSTVHFEYTPAFEDVQPPMVPDEVADGRRFQFFAMCRDKSPQRALPQWITYADLDAAGMAISKFDPGTVAAEQVLEDPASTWSDCFVRITPDDARIEITKANAAAGVDWDVSGLAPGVFSIHGYTWDPSVNLWSSRTGFVKVHDGDPTTAGPAVAVTSSEQIVYLGEVAMIEGCVDAGDSATLDFYWSYTDNEDWQPFLQGEPVGGDAFGVEFMPPDGVAGDSVMIRVDVTDGGQTHTAYMHDLVVVLESENPNTCGEGGGFINDPGCADTGGATGGSGDGSGSATGGGATSGPTSGGDGTGGGTGETTAMADGGDGGGGGCSCRAAGHDRGPFGLMLLVLLALPRRVRRG